MNITDNNVHATLPQLPTELLAQIFLWLIMIICSEASCAHQYKTSDYVCPGVPIQFLTPPSPYSWLVIRHICRSWRRIALDFPELSTHIFIARPRCVEDLLNRSKGLPLHVYQASSMYERARRDEVAMSCRLILAQFNRVASGSLMLSEATNAPKHSFSKKTISKATALEIECQGAGLNDASSVISNFEFPNLTLLSGRNTDLRLLRAMVVPGLRTLRLIQSEGISKGDLHHILRSMRQLEELVLSNAIEGEEDWTSIQTSYILGMQETVELPKLKLLNITELCASKGIPLLQSIEHPAHTAVYLNFQKLSSGSIDDHNSECLLQLLVRSIQAWNRIAEFSPQSLRICADKGTMNMNTVVSLWHKKWPLEELRASSKNNPFFHLSFQSDQKGFMASLLPQLPLSNVTAAFIVDSASIWSAAQWETLLKELPSAEDIAISCQYMDDAARYIRHAHWNAQEVCPRLRNLHLCEIITTKEHLFPMSAAKDSCTLTHIARSLAAGLRRQSGGDPVNLIARVVDETGTERAEKMLSNSISQTARSWVTKGMATVSTTLGFTGF